MAYRRPFDGDIDISDSWQGHRDRPTPSSEPGVDYACGPGTAVLAPADGVIRDTHDSPDGGGGRTVLLRTGDDWHRALHLSSIEPGIFPGKRVSQGQVIARSGRSAAGSEFGVGSHLHWTFWRARGDIPPVPGTTRTDDFERFVGQNRSAGVGSFEEDDMFSEEDRALLTTVRNEIMNTHAGIWSGGQASIDGQVRVFNYGVLPIVVRNQELIAELWGKIAGLEEVVKQLTTTNNVMLDVDAINAANDLGARDARNGFANDVVTIHPDIP
ncbi:M23 family metallopeptidase [Microbacterium sp.]|uniref:M23 family metallopeptidase n=1 Tax=Microbacterium sp. TaxID=51671 RepID=UPI002E344172|nr:M23 family metallopeptidase [Microbacterium sp.]HEX5730155.1 M23 family metallopeptidase [Microbacterium sp.]